MLDTQLNPKERSRRKAQSERPRRDRLLNVKQIAEDVFGCHPATVRRLIASGKLKAVQLSKRRLGVRESAIEKYMADNEVAAP